MMNVPIEQVPIENNESDSSSDSLCSSCCKHSDSSIPEWDSAVQENGDLFFIKCSPVIYDTQTNHGESSSKSVGKSNRFSTFLRRQKPKKYDVSENTNQGNEFPTSSTVSNHFDGLSNNPIAVLFLNLASLENSDSNGSDTYFQFPDSGDENIIFLIRGALITMFHLLPKLLSEKPESCTISIKEEIVHIIFIEENINLMILACPESRCSLFKLKQFGANILNYLNFKYGSLYETFSNPTHHTNLNSFFGNFFIKLLSNKFNLFVSDVSHANTNEGKNEGSTGLEETFIYPRTLTISSNLMSKINEKLNELEANDFGDLSEDHYGCQRLFTIIGTCLYFKGYLIANHLQQNDLNDVHVYLRMNDILDLTVTSVMETLIVWQEVHLSSFKCNLGSNQRLADNRRWFLLVIGKDHGLLVTLLECGGCSVKTTEVCRPDELYVEQIQDTLSDILHFDLSEEVEQYTRSSCSNLTSKIRKSPKKSSDNSVLNTSSNSNTLKMSDDHNSSRSVENDSSTINYPSSTSGTYEDTFSETISRTTSSAYSDDAAPVLGRRAQRLQQLGNSGSVYTLSQANLSDSDHSDCDITGNSYGNSFNSSKNYSTKNIIMPKKILHSDKKTIFYYINIRSNRGVMLYSFKNFNSDVAQRSQAILKNFILSAEKIHAVFMYRNSSAINESQRSHLPVKEYGLLFEYNCPKDESEKKTSVSTTYWVVGRTFDQPQFGEVYVCYEDNTPQNLVEIAFRLAMS